MTPMTQNTSSKAKTPSLKMMEHLSKLSRIKLSDEEKQSFLSDLKHILVFVEKINEVDTENVQPLYSPVEAFTPTQKDVAVALNEQSMDHSKIAENAPNFQLGYFVVPRVIEE